MVGQLGFPAEPDTGLHRPFPALGGPGSDEAPLKLSKAPKDGEHQPAMRS